MVNIAFLHLDLRDAISEDGGIYVMPYEVAKCVHSATHIVVSGIPFGKATDYYLVPAWLDGYGGEDFCRLELACGGFYITAYGNALQLHQYESEGE